MLHDTWITLVSGIKMGTENVSSPECNSVGVAFFGPLSWNKICLPETRNDFGKLCVVCVYHIECAM